MDSGNHYIALMFWLTELEPEEVFCYKESQGLKVDVNTSLSFRLKGGVLGSASILGDDTAFRDTFFIWGDRGVISLSTGDAYYELKGKKEKVVLNDSSFPLPAKNPVEDLLKVIKNEKEPETSWSIVEKIAFFTDKALESAKIGKPVKIKRSTAD